MKILINDKEIVFNKEDFPILITGACKTGSSLFSISLVTSLFENNNKVLFLTAYPEAKVDFRRQLGDKINDNAIIVDSGEESVFIENLYQMSDLNDIIILLKYTIFSGDIDNCVFGDELVKMDFKTKIFFSYPNKLEVGNKIELPKYNGMIMNQKYYGIIKFEE